MFTASDVKNLREKTGAGMMDCKKSLTETNGDVEKAIDWLRAKGLAAAAKKADRSAAEGLVSIYAAGTSAAIVEVNAETDFVARNDQFRDFVKNLSHRMHEARDFDSLESSTYADGKSVDDTLKSLIALIGENMKIRRGSYLSVEKGLVATYMHNAVEPDLGKIGVLVALSSEGDLDKLSEFGRKLAMHIAAAKPIAMDVDSLSDEVVARERAVIQEKTAAGPSKPADVVEKIVDGGLNKFYTQNVLMNQIFLLSEDKITVSDAVLKFEKELGTPVHFIDYARFELGEGVEKKQENFAEEVAAQIK